MTRSATGAAYATARLEQSFVAKQFMVLERKITT